MTVRSIRRSIAAVAGVLTGTMLLAVPADAAPPSEEQLAEFTKGGRSRTCSSTSRRCSERATPTAATGQRPSRIRRIGRLRGRQAGGGGYTPVVQEFDFMYTEENSELERIFPNPTTYIRERTSSATGSTAESRRGDGVAVPG